MKISTSLAILSVVAASSSAFGLHGAGAKNLVRSSTRAVGGAFQKNPAMVQPVDIQGNRISSSVVSTLQSIINHQYNLETSRRIYIDRLIDDGMKKLSCCGVF